MISMFIYTTLYVHSIVKKKNIKEAKALLKKHPDIVNEKGVFGNTALHVAAQYNLPEVVHTLLDHSSIDINPLNDKVKFLFSMISDGNWMYQKGNGFFFCFMLHLLCFVGYTSHLSCDSISNERYYGFIYRKGLGGL